MGITRSLLFSVIVLIIFLLRDVVPTSYAGAALIYALQVCYMAARHMSEASEGLYILRLCFLF